jgi:alpha-tubulin suppressor-like RCC1 family protein
MRPDVAGGRHNCYRTIGSPSTIYCWGANVSGQVGNGTSSAAVLTPTALSAPTDSAQLALGDAHTCAWRNAGHAFVCWGANDQGQLGTGNMTEAHAPVAVSTTSGLAPSAAASGLFVTAGDSHTCAVDEAHHVWCWGANASGQLGTGNTTAHTTPFRSTLTPAVDDVRAGALHTCAIAGTDLWCWGANSNGQVGDGTTVDALTPARITP